MDSSKQCFQCTDLKDSTIIQTHSLQQLFVITFRACEHFNFDIPNDGFFLIYWGLVSETGRSHLKPTVGKMIWTKQTLWIFHKK